MALEKEVKTYDEKLPELLAHEGKFVLIHAEEIVGFFDSYGDALQTGYKKFGLDEFLVKQIRAVELVQFVARI